MYVPYNRSYTQPESVVQRQPPFFNVLHTPRFLPHTMRSFDHAILAVVKITTEIIQQCLCTVNLRFIVKRGTQFILLVADV